MDTPAPEPNETLSENAKYDNLVLYEYNRLPENCIRLLQLNPGSGEAEQISCRLVTVPIANKPAYIAISYVWGDASNTVPIKCDEHYLRVTVNLRDALLRFRNPDQSRFLWADAVCINQADDGEKSQQVAMMGLIYHNAQRVNVWLGHVDEGPTGAQAALQSMATAVGLYRDDLKKYGSKDLIPRYKSDDLLAVEGADKIQHPDWAGWVHSSGWIEHDGWEALRRMFAKPWFSRVWIVQEVGLAKDAWFFFGTSGTLAVRLKELTEFMDWLFHSAQVIAQYFEFDTRLYDLMYSYRSVVHDQQEGSPTQNTDSFLDVLDRARGFQCSNNLDTVYAFLGHPTALESFHATEHPLHCDYATRLATSSTIIVPRYGGRTELDVYLELANTIVDKRNIGLNILLYVAHENEESLYEVAFPSWVPRWDISKAPRCFAPPSRTYYDASGSLRTTDVEIVENHYLKLKALRLNKIIFWYLFPESCWFVTWASRYKFVTNLATEGELNPVETLWQEFSKTRQTFTASSDHLNDDTSFAVTLTAGLTSDGLQLTNFERHYANFCAYRLAKAKLWGPELTGNVLENLEKHVEEGDADEYFCAVQKACANRAFFYTDKGNIGLGPRILGEGDELWLPLGSKVPYLLRPTYGKFGDCYRVLGQAYMHGIMEGEAVRGLSEETFQEIYLC